MEAVIALMENHCIGETNVTFERFIFNGRAQGEHETFDQYLTSLRELVRTCRFGAMEADLLKDRIVCGVYDNAVREKLLQRKDLNLDTCIDMFRASESTTRQLQTMGAVEKGHRINQKGKRDAERKTKTKQQGPTEKQECHYRGWQHGPKREQCRAYGKTCAVCGKDNHFARKCLQKKRRQRSTHHKVSHIQDNGTSSEEDKSGSEDSEWLLTISLKPEKRRRLCCDSKGVSEAAFCDHGGGRKPTQFQMDTGATCNVLTLSDLPDTIQIQPTNQILSLFSKGTLKPVGKCQARVRNRNTRKRYVGEFVVVKEVQTSILGARSLQQMGLIVVQQDTINVVQQKPEALTS